ARGWTEPRAAAVLRPPSAASRHSAVVLNRRRKSMRTRIRPGRLALAAGTALTLTLPLLAAAPGHAAGTESLSVDLSSTRGPSTGVGEGFLYGFSEDGTQPVDQFIQPLGINAFRGGGWFSGGWIKDNYQLGSATQADINSIVAEGRPLT